MLINKVLEVCFQRKRQPIENVLFKMTVSLVKLVNKAKDENKIHYQYSGTSSIKPLMTTCPKYMPHLL